jgi:hypothetical protein
MTRTTEKSDKPAGDGASVIAVQFDLLNEIFRLSMEGAHAIATRQSQAMSDLHRQFTYLMSRSAGPSASENGAASGMVFAREAFGTGLSHGLAVTEIAVKMEMETLAILNRSFSAGLNGTFQKILPIKVP